MASRCQRTEQPCVLPWVHRVFANAKRWGLGVYHGLRPEHLQAYLDEFVFRFNRLPPDPARHFHPTTRWIPARGATG